ncbi:thiol-disulfide oxidoreductase [Tenacibaculum holothuriorum]|uniref:Thiol-disulfide oxidoreductase n=1 Tax=Tenacibaculum holothuriorum TaxID=1635173 RepID=A0A1Y2PFX5_9FLAO|nr:TlpA disulfide reductase family protein [Tenacibaculum holothuriorum]OSY89384.1 thiol-disulfide oxidoreductase [Tenacibaculum holothuriorum]
MKLSKRQISNLIFLIIIGLLIYPPTKIQFIRLISFAPSIIEKNKQQKLNNYNWSLEGLNTTEAVNFNELKNKVVFVNFWATWCPPCVAEMPSIKKLHKDYKDKVVFIFVSNEKWPVINKFYRENEYDFPTYNNLSNPPKELSSSSIPATFIINKEGSIVMSKKGAANWNSDKVRVLLDSSLKEEVRVN